MEHWATLLRAIFKRAEGWLPGWVLRRLYSESECKNKLLFHIQNGGPTFELKNTRLTLALIGIQIGVVNLLPFTSDVEMTAVEIEQNSRRLLPNALNRHFAVNPFSGTVATLDHIDLSVDQKEEVSRYGAGGTRLQCILSVRVSSSVRTFNYRVRLSVNAAVNSDCLVEGR